MKYQKDKDLAEITYPTEMKELDCNLEYVVERKKKMDRLANIWSDSSFTWLNQEKTKYIPFHMSA